MISPEAGDCPAELPPDEVRQGVRGDGPQVRLPSLVGHGGQTIQPERNKLENTARLSSGVITYLEPSGKTSGMSSFNSTRRFLFSF